MLNKQTITYSIGLLLSNFLSKKTCEALGKLWDKSGDSMLRVLEKKPASYAELMEIAKKFFKKKKLYLILDDTLISKIFSTLIAGTSDNFDSSTSQCYRSLCSITAMLTDGKYA